MTMGKEDKIFLKKEKNKAMLKRAEAKQRERQNNSQTEKPSKSDDDLSELCETSVTESTDEDDELVISQYHQRKLSAKPVITPSSTSHSQTTTAKMNKR